MPNEPPALPKPVKKAPPDWESIAAAYRTGVLSIREIAKQHAISDTAIRQRASRDGWQRDLSTQVAQRVRSELLRTQDDDQLRTQLRTGLRSEDQGQLRTELRSADQAQLRTQLRTPLRSSADENEPPSPAEGQFHVQDDGQLRTPLRTPYAHEQVRSDSQIVDDAAATQVFVVRSHRADISLGRDVVALLLGQAVQAAQCRDELESIIVDETADDKSPQRRTQLMRAVSIPAHAKVINDLSAAMKNLIQLERQAFNIGDSAAPPPAEDATDDELDRAIAMYAAKAGVKLVAGGEGETGH